MIIFLLTIISTIIIFIIPSHLNNTKIKVVKVSIPMQKGEILTIEKITDNFQEVFCDKDDLLPEEKKPIHSILELKRYARESLKYTLHPGDVVLSDDFIQTEFYE